MFPLGRARLGVHHNVRRDDFSNAFFNRIAQCMNLFEARGPRDADRSVHKVTVAGAAYPDAVNVQHAFHSRYCPRDGLLQTFGCNIQQSIQRALAQARAHPENHRRDH